MQPESGPLGVAGDVATAAVALAGLVLVFLGATTAAFETYQRQEKGSVLSRYQRRAWLSLVGFVSSLVAAALAIVGKWLQNECAALAAIYMLFAAFALVLVAAIVVVTDIK